MNKKLIAAALLSACMLTGCGSNTTSTGKLGSVEIVQDSSAADTTAPVSSETTTYPSSETITTPATEATTAAAPADTTEAPAQSSETQTTGTGTTTASTQSSTSTTTTTQAPQKQLLDEVKLGQDCSAYVAAHKDLIKPIEETDSCLGSGKDRVYTYSNYILRSYYEDGKDTLKEINITGAGIKDRSGIEVGMKVSDIIAAHGNPVSDGDYTYDTDWGTVEYRCTGDTIDEIWIY